MISVIVAILNGMPYVEQALHSILQQQDEIKEIIIVDGGSTDGSLAVALSCPEAQIFHQPGRGLAAARNQGLSEARGDMIAFLDADDYWAVEWLSAARKYLEFNADCQAVVGQMSRFLESPPPPETHASGWLGQPTIGYTPGALLARKKVFDQIGNFDEAFEIGCDTDWFVRALDAGVRLTPIPQVALNKRIHQDNLSANIIRYRNELLRITRHSLMRRRKLPLISPKTIYSHS